MSDIAHKVRAAYKLDTVLPEHPLRLLCDEIERLQHDVERHIGIAATYVEWVERLRAMLREAQELIEAVPMHAEGHRTFRDELCTRIDALLAKEGA